VNPPFVSAAMFLASMCFSPSIPKPGVTPEATFSLNLFPTVELAVVNPSEASAALFAAQRDRCLRAGLPCACESCVKTQRFSIS
jgi:hypothetical protein